MKSIFTAGPTMKWLISSVIGIVVASVWTYVFSKSSGLVNSNATMAAVIGEVTQTPNTVVAMPRANPKKRPSIRCRFKSVTSGELMYTRVRNAMQKING